MVRTKNKEGVDTIYDDGKLVAIIKRDNESKKHIIYKVQEATSDDIAEMFVESGFQVENHIKKEETL